MLSQNRFTHTPSQPAVTTALLPRASKVISKELEFLKKEITKLEASSEMINGVQNEVITKLEIVSRDSKAKKGDLADVQAAQKNLDASTKVFDTHNQDLERARATITTLESELLEAQMVEALVKAALDYDTLKAEYAKLEAGLIEFMTKTSMRMSKLRTVINANKVD